MKGRISVLVLTIVLILGLSVSIALAGSPVTYLGKTTWTLKITDADNPDRIGESVTVTGGISKVGDEFYLFQGYVTPDGDGPFVISGSGFLMNNTTLVFTLAESQQHTSIPWRDSGVMHVSIDKATLNGTVYDIGRDFNPDTGARVFNERYTAGDLTLKGSPIPLNVSLAPLQLLLE